MKWGTSMEDSLQIQEIDSKMAEKTEDENFTGIAKKCVSSLITFASVCIRNQRMK